MLLPYEMAGVHERSPILFLHSSVADSRMWDPQWTDLAGSHRLLRCDFRGFGSAELPGGRYRDSDDVLEVLDAVSAESVAVVGSSYGGRVALELAAAHPARVRRLILLCPGFAGLSPTSDAEAFDAAEEELLVDDDVEGAVRLNVATWLGPAADDRTRAWLGEMQANNFRIQLSASADAEPDVPMLDPSTIETPALIISGAHDLDHFRNIAAHLTAEMPHASGMTLDWAGHLPSLEQPAEITALLAAALDTYW